MLRGADLFSARILAGLGASTWRPAYLQSVLPLRMVLYLNSLAAVSVTSVLYLVSTSEGNVGSDRSEIVDGERPGLLPGLAVAGSYGLPRESSLATAVLTLRRGCLP
jgi:hypothetical protein